MINSMICLLKRVEHSSNIFINKSTDRALHKTVSPDLAPDVLALDVLAPDVLAPDVLAPDVSVIDILTGDVRAHDVLQLDVPASDNDNDNE